MLYCNYMYLSMHYQYDSIHIYYDQGPVWIWPTSWSFAAEEGLKDLTFSVGSSYTTGSFKYLPISFHITYLHHVTPLVVELCFICFIFPSQSMRMMTMTTCQNFRFLQGWWPRQKWSGE